MTGQSILVSVGLLAAVWGSCLIIFREWLSDHARVPRPPRIFAYMGAFIAAFGAVVAVGGWTGLIA